MRTLREWQVIAHSLAVEKGFYKGRDSTNDLLWDATRLMKIVAELAEAYEDIKKGNTTDRLDENGKPQGLGHELADVFLFLVDFAESKNIDLESVVETKHRFNCSRPYMHGNKL